MLKEISEQPSDYGEFQKRQNAMVELFDDPSRYLRDTKNICVPLPIYPAPGRKGVMFMGHDLNPAHIYFVATAELLKNMDHSYFDPSFDPKAVSEMKKEAPLVELRMAMLASKDGDVLVLHDGDEEFKLQALDTMRKSLESFNIHITDQVLFTHSPDEWIDKQKGQVAISPNVFLPAHVASYAGSRVQEQEMFNMFGRSVALGIKDCTTDFLWSKGIAAPFSRTLDPRVNSVEDMARSIVEDHEGLGRYERIYLKQANGRAGGVGVVESGKSLEELMENIIKLGDLRSIQAQKGLKLISSPCVLVSYTNNDAEIDMFSEQRLLRENGHPKYNGNKWNKDSTLRPDAWKLLQKTVGFFQKDGKQRGPANIDLGLTRLKSALPVRRGQVIREPVCSFVIEQNSPRYAGSTFSILPFIDKEIDGEPITQALATKTVAVALSTFRNEGFLKSLKGDLPKGIDVGIVGAGRREGEETVYVSLTFCATENILPEKLEKFESTKIKQIEDFFPQN